MEDVKILFKNSSKIELEDLKNFSAFVSTKYNKYKYWIIVILAFINIILFGIVRAINQINRFHIISVSTILNVLVFASIILGVVGWKKGKVNEKNINKDLKYTYEFTDKYILIKTNMLASQKILFDG